MRYIELKEVETRKGQTMDYRKQLEVVVGEISQDANGERRGFDRETNRRALRILDALEDCDGDVLALEDADHQFLVARIGTFLWPWADWSFERFCTDVTDAPSKPPEPAEKTNAAKT